MSVNVKQFLSIYKLQITGKVMPKINLLIPTFSLWHHMVMVNRLHVLAYSIQYIIYNIYIYIFPLLWAPLSPPINHLLHWNQNECYFNERIYLDKYTFSCSYFFNTLEMFIIKTDGCCYKWTFSSCLQND